MRFFWLMLVYISCTQALMAQSKGTVIAFASDTQEPMWVEKIIRKPNHNLLATKMIFADIDSLRPKAFFILGDVVSLGKKKKAWKNIDHYLAQTVKDSIPVYATLGNHEVMFNAAKGTRNFKTRFPAYDPSGYTKVVDSVAIILLNSNFAAMSATATVSQNNWYRAKLKALDNDPSVKMVIVGCHHSPYTNSKIVKPSVAVQQNFVPPFIQSKKGILFLSGHSHNFEHFEAHGKTFLVIGGGGGLHQPLHPGSEQMKDLSADYKPAFHYLEVRRDGYQLRVISRRLKPDFSGFDNGLSFRLQGYH